MMENRTGRLDLLLLGIVERIASRDPVYAAVYQTFEPEIRAALGNLDSPRLRRAVKALASGGREQARVTGKRKEAERKPKTAAPRRKKAAFKAQVRIAKPSTEPVEVVEAEWVS
jgi:hypothetical protein